MILGIGTDIVSVNRIRLAMARVGLIQRILTESEWRANMEPEFVAGRWAAKEAIKKCCPWINSWHQVKILPDGPPSATVEGLPENEQVLISISHEHEFAVATAIRCKIQ